MSAPTPLPVDRFTYKGQSFTAVAVEPITRWQSRCMTCRQEYEVTTPGDHAQPPSPVRRCRDCRAKRRKRLADQRRRKMEADIRRELKPTTRRKPTGLSPEIKDIL